MSRTRRFLSGVALGYTSQALTMLVGLWLTPFLLGRLGQHDYGLWLVGTQVLIYLMLMDFGVVALLPRSTAYATGSAGGFEKAADLPEIIGQAARMVLWQTPLVLIGAALLWHSTTARWTELRLPLGLVLFTFVLMFPLRIFQAVLQGLQDLTFLGRLQIVSWLLSTAATIGLVLMGMKLEALAAGWAIGQLLPVVCCWWRLRSRFRGVLPGRPSPLPWPAARTQLSKGFWVSVSQVASVLLNGVDLFIIGAVLGPAAVVPFACTSKLVSVLANQPQLFVNSALPALSQMKASEPRERLLQVNLLLSQAMLLFSGLVVSLTLLVNEGFVSLWVGRHLYGGWGLTLLILIVIPLRHWNLTIGQCLFCFGYERRLAVVGLLDGLAASLGAAILVSIFGVKGVPLGALLGVCLIGLPANLFAQARETGVSVNYLLKQLWPLFWRLGLMLTLISLSLRWKAPVTPIQLAASGAVLIAAYVALMWPVVYNSALRIYLMPELNRWRLRLTGLLWARA